MINEVIDNMFKFDVEFNPGDGEERHLALTHIYKNGPKFNLGSGKCIRLINCIVELDENGNLDTFRATAFADGFFESELSKVDRVILGEYKNTRWKYDSFRDIYSEWPKERRAQMRAIEKVKARTKKPLIETIRFLAKFVIERHVALPDRSGDEARAKERREQERPNKHMEQLRAELERMRRTVGKSFNESRMLLKMLVNETIDRYLFKNTRRKVLREHDPDDPDYGQYGDAYDAYYAAKNYVHDCELECGIAYWIDPLTKEIFKDGEEHDGCIDFYFVPKFDIDGSDEYGFELEDIDFDIDDDSYQQFGDIISQYIDDNFDELYNEIKKDSTYTIY